MPIRNQSTSFHRQVGCQAVNTILKKNAELSNHLQTVNMKKKVDAKFYTFKIASLLQVNRLPERVI